MLPVELSIGKYLNPGEEHEEVTKEKSRRRNARLAQVHKLASENELRIVKAVELEKTGSLKQLGNSLKAQWIKEKKDQIVDVGTEYGKCLHQIGNGHKEVFFEDTRLEVLKAQASQNKLKSEIRGRSAKIEKIKLDNKKIEDLNLKKVFRKKSCEFGNRASQVLLKSSKTNLPIIISKNYRPGDLDPLEDVKEQEDARIAAEKENRNFTELKSLTVLQKTNHEAKVKERYLLAMKTLQRENGMKEFINKLEEIEEFNEYSVSINGNTLNFDKDREKAVERLFQSFGLPTKLSFYESTPSTFDHSSRFASNSTSHSDRESPAHIFILKQNKRLLSEKTSISDESTLPTSTPSISKSESSKQFDDSSSIRTDDEKMKRVVLQLHDSESILAGNLRTPESTIQFSESSNGWSSSSEKLLGGIKELQSLKKKLEPMLNSPLELSNQNAASDQQTFLEKIATTDENYQKINFNEDSFKNVNADLSILSESAPKTFHNVMIFKKPDKKYISKSSEERNRNLKELVSLVLKSKKMLQSLADQNTQQGQLPEIGHQLSVDRISESSNTSTLLQNSPSRHSKVLKPYFSQMGIRRRNLELSTIMEMDSPRSSTFPNLQLPSMLGASSIVSENDSYSLFDIISENENGILQEPDLTLVSSITSLGDSTGISQQQVPFIVKSVKTNAIDVNSTNESLQTKAKTRLTDYKFNDSLSFLNKISLEQTPTLDSESWRSCLTDNGYPSINQSNTNSVKSIGKNNLGTISYKSSDGNSITDELLSNSMISFLAHEMSASSYSSDIEHKNVI